VVCWSREKNAVGKETNTETRPAPLSGRRAEAARNDGLILEAAREVFVADPKAPISAVAERAGVGIGALYRRYGSKEDLLRRLNADGLRIYIAAVEEALADEGDRWYAFAGLMRRAVDADTHSLTLRLAGTFTPTEELYCEGQRAQELNVRLFGRTRPRAPSGQTSRSTTSPSCSSSWRPSASGTNSGLASFAIGIWRCCSTPSTPPQALRRVGRRSTGAGRPSSSAAVSPPRDALPSRAGN
jgi:AcrR family transcriptional regulator